MIKLSDLWLSDRWRMNLGFLSIIFLFVILVSFSYTSSERTFYAGDFAPVYYHNNAQLVVSAWRQSPLKAIASIWQSLDRGHNQLFVLPLLPLLLIFGDSRTSYIMSVAVVYLLPWSLVMGAIASRLIYLAHPLLIFYLTTGISLLLPMSWLPTLRGYPDIGGALIIGISILLLLPKLEPQELPINSPILNQISWLRVAIIGLLLGLAMLFRRHFAYMDIAIFVGIIIQSIVTIFAAQKQIVSSLFLLGRKLSLIGAIALLTLLISAREFTTRALITDFRDLYASWSLSFIEIFVHYGNFYGWLTWVLIILGFSLSLMKRTWHISGIVFISSTGIASLFNLLVIIRYDSFQYTLHFTPFAVISLVILGTTVYKIFPDKSKLIIISSSIYLGINFLFMLTGLGKLEFPLRSLLAANYPPQVRQDYQQIQKLTAYLRQVAPNKEPIYVISSSAMDYLSRGVLNNAEATIYGKNKTILNILRPQSFDSNSSYPLESLLKAKYVVMPQPMQYRFSLKHHDVARVSAEIFNENWEFAEDFQLLPQTFTLENKAVVQVYKRIRFTSIPLAVKTLEKIQQELKEVPGGQKDWVILSQQFPLEIKKKFSQTYSLNAHAGYRNQLPVSALIYLPPLPDILHIKGTVKFPDQACLGVSLRAAIYNQQGTVITSTETFKSPQFPSVFFLSTATKGGKYLVWQILSPDAQEIINHCPVEINNLTLGVRP